MRLLTVAFLAGVALTAGAQDKGQSYNIKGEEFEACECSVYCPCIWKKDVTFEQCRALIAWTVTEGSCGKIDLKGVTFVVALTKTDKNIVKSMGNWEGIIYVSDKASKEQQEAAAKILSIRYGKAFKKIEVKTAPIETKADGDSKTLTIGKIATLKITPLKNDDGSIPSIENAPFRLINKVYCAKADVHTYDDGTNKWDFAGRNAYYGPFEYKSE